MVDAAEKSRSGVALGLAVIASNACQLGWLLAASRSLDSHRYGTVLAAQASYGLLQIAVDIGPAFYGARISANGPVSGEARSVVAGLRARLGLAAAALMLAIGVAGGADLLIASAPYALALLLLALLNVWEAYGAGNIFPYAAYLFLRSGVLMGVAIPFALTGTRYPLPLAGASESAAIIIVIVLARRPVLRDTARGLARPASALPWRTVASIGGPALISQYCVAAGTVILALSGRAAAAASLAIGVRLLSGLQGLQGAVATAAFPRLARGGAAVSRERDGRVNGRILAMIVLSSAAALAVAGLAAGPVTRLLLAHPSRRDELVMLLVVSAATAAGATLQLSFGLVARHLERRIITASLCGAGVITAGALLAGVAAGPGDAALLAAVSFVSGQLLTAAMLIVAAQRPGLIPPRVAISTLGAAGIAVGVAILAHGFPAPAAAIGLTVGLGAAAVAWGPPRRRSARPSPPIRRDLPTG